MSDVYKTIWIQASMVGWNGHRSPFFVYRISLGNLGDFQAAVFFFLCGTRGMFFSENMPRCLRGWGHHTTCLAPPINKAQMITSIRSRWEVQVVKAPACLSQRTFEMARGPKDLISPAGNDGVAKGLFSKTLVLNKCRNPLLNPCSWWGRVVWKAP